MNHVNCGSRVGSLHAKSRLYRLILLVFFSFVWVARLNAGAPQAGNSHLDAVEVTGSARFTSKQIVAALGLRTGTVTNRDGLQKVADKLSALGAFATVSYHFSTVATGVRVTYEVTDAALLPVTFDNFPWFSDEELSAALKGSVGLFDGSAPASGTLIDAMDDALAKFLDGHGIHAQVTHKTIPLADRDAQVVQFHVEEAALTVQSIEFSDALAKSDLHIQDRLTDIVGQPYSRSKIELFEFEQLRPIYLVHGYLRAKFLSPVAKFPAPPANPLAGALVVTAQIEPGPPYQWGGIEWSGNSAVSNADLDGVVQMQAGSLADGNQIESVWKRVIDRYEEAGFLSVDIEHTPRFDDKNAKVSYAVKITEGPQYHMRSLILTGLSVEGERRIRKAFPIPQDALFDRTAYQIFMNKGLSAAFSGLPVHYSKVGNFLQLDIPNAKVDVLLDFQ
jgi:outer membrane protein assembly factor BamA